MRKILIIVISIIVIAVIGGFLWWEDNTKAIEEVRGYSTEQKLAYSLNEDINTIYVTIYGKKGADLVKTVTIYNFENDNLNKIIVEKHYENKLQAKSYLKENLENVDKAYVKDNIIITESQINTAKTRTDVLKEFEGRENIWLKVE